MHAGMLQVDRIVVRGTDRLSVGEVLAVLNELRGQNIVWADLGLAPAPSFLALGARRGVLRRSLPSTVEVIVFEREPIGIPASAGPVSHRRTSGRHPQIRPPIRGCGFADRRRVLWRQRRRRPRLIPTRRTRSFLGD